MRLPRLPGPPVRGLRGLTLGTALALGLLIVVLLLAMQASSTPRFCGSCHIMKPYYLSWQQSRHNRIACIECHISPGIGAELRTAAALTARAEGVPLNTEDYSARLGEARTYLSEALPAAHAVREDLAAGFAGRSRSVSEEIESEIYAKLQEMRTRRIVLIVFWFYLLLTIFILARFRRGESKT